MTDPSQSADPTTIQSFIATVGAGLTATLLATWLLGLLNTLVPSPQRLRRALCNIRRIRRKRPQDRFHVVLCWLEDDPKGINTKNVYLPLLQLQSVRKDLSAHIVDVTAMFESRNPGVSDEPRKVLDAWGADLAIVGRVKKTNEVVSLWFIQRSTGKIFPQADRPYKLADVTLGDDFRDDLHAQIAATALTAVMPLANSDVRANRIKAELYDATNKLTELLAAPGITSPDDQAALQLVLGNALLVLGQHHNDAQRLTGAVKAYTAALKTFSDRHLPHHFATAQENLGIALFTLSRHEVDPTRLEDAIHAHRAALRHHKPKSAPVDYAASRSNLANVLLELGQRKNQTERIEEAIAVLQTALNDIPREDAPLTWAALQCNLANALAKLGVELTRFCGHPETVVRRCHDGEVETVCAGVPAADGGAGSHGPHGAGVVPGVRVFAAGDPQLGASGGA